jgi:hypothetical protein
MNNSWLLTHDWIVVKGALMSFILSICFIAILKSLKFNPNLFHIPRNIIRFFIYLKRGRRYMAKIDGTWRIVKGNKSAGGFLHTDKLFPDNQSHCLDDNEFHKIEITTSDDEVQDKIVALNLRSLQIAHPLKNRFNPRGRPQDPFAEPHRRYNPYEEALRTLSPDMRAYMERELNLEGLND